MPLLSFQLGLCVAGVDLADDLGGIVQERVIIRKTMSPPPNLVTVSSHAF